MNYSYDAWFDIKTFKPYLRPLSSMTTEEMTELVAIEDTVLKVGAKGYTCILSLKQTKWFLRKHFDYLGMIDKGFALETSGEIYTNEQI